MAEYWRSDGHNVSVAARLFGINRCVVYDILRKWAEGDLRERPKTPKHQPNKTPAGVEDKVIAAKNKTRLGPERLTRLGFAEWEAKVYLALLQRSPVTGYQVSKDSGVPRSMVYQVLGKLVNRGAALITHDGDSVLYAPVPPLELMERL